MEPTVEMGGLGRRAPTNLDHVRRMPFSAVAAQTVASVERRMILPRWHKTHDQGQEGSCVGHGTSMMLAILNEHQVRRQGQRDPYIRYNPWWLWNRAKEVDEWDDTVPGDTNGTSVKAACQIISTEGHVLWKDTAKQTQEDSPQIDFGISQVRWAVSVDEVRTAIAACIPVSIGVNWYSRFGSPEYKNGEYWIGNSTFGTISGGHCVCVYGASDERQAVRIKNSWGPSYPEVYLPYKALERLIEENGEIALSTDR